MPAKTIQWHRRETVNRRWQAVKDFFYGMTGHQFVQHARGMKHETESIFLIVTLGDLIGVPVMPPVYALRLLPFVAPAIATWKRQMARRKEFWEKEEYDLQGM